VVLCLHLLPTMAFLDRPGAALLRPVWRGVAGCARGHHGRRIGKLLLGVALFKIGMKLYGGYKARQRRQRWAEAGKDVVVLHQFQRGTHVPNLSPFALKLETWLRMADIKYVIDTDEPQSASKGKCPWITINGIELSDSELIIDYLTQHFNKPVPDTLSVRDHGVGRAVQVMLDEHTIVAVAYKRYQIDRMKHMLQWIKFPKPMMVIGWLMWPYIMRSIKKVFYINGMGRYSEEEAMFLMFRELRALEDIIGEKTFLLADAPTAYDAAVFAELTQVIYCCAPEVERRVRETHAPLVQYHERVKAKYWSDWEQCRDN